MVRINTTSLLIVVGLTLGVTPTAPAIDPDRRGIDPFTGGYNKDLHDSTRGDRGAGMGNDKMHNLHRMPQIPESVRRLERPIATSVVTGQPVNEYQLALLASNRVSAGAPNLPSSVETLQRNATCVSTGLACNADRLPTPRGDFPAPGVSGFRLAARGVDQTLGNVVRGVCSEYQDFFHFHGIQPPTALEWLEVANLIGDMRNLSHGNLRGIAEGQMVSPIEKGVVNGLGTVVNELRKLKDDYLYDTPKPGTVRGGEDELRKLKDDYLYGPLPRN